MAEESKQEEPSATGNGGRRVVAGTFVTLDGYMVGPDEDMGWVGADFDPEMQADTPASS